MVSARRSPCKLRVQAQRRRRDGIGFVGGDGGGGHVGGDVMTAVAMVAAMAASKAVRWGYCGNTTGVAFRVVLVHGLAWREHGGCHGRTTLKEPSKRGGLQLENTSGVETGSVRR